MGIRTLLATAGLACALSAPLAGQVRVFERPQASLSITHSLESDKGYFDGLDASASVAAVCRNAVCLQLESRVHTYNLIPGSGSFQGIRADAGLGMGVQFTRSLSAAVTYFGSGLGFRRPYDAFTLPNGAPVPAGELSTAGSERFATLALAWRSKDVALRYERLLFSDESFVGAVTDRLQAGVRLPPFALSLTSVRTRRAGEQPNYDPHVTTYLSIRPVVHEHGFFARALNGFSLAAGSVSRFDVLGATSNPLALHFPTNAPDSFLWLRYTLSVGVN